MFSGAVSVHSGVREGGSDTRHPLSLVSLCSPEVAHDWEYLTAFVVVVILSGLIRMRNFPLAYPHLGQCDRGQFCAGFAGVEEPHTDSRS